MFHQTSILKNNCLGYQDDIEFPMGNFSHQPPNRLLGQGVEEFERDGCFGPQWRGIWLCRDLEEDMIRNPRVEMVFVSKIWEKTNVKIKVFRKKCEWYAELTPGFMRYVRCFWISPRSKLVIPHWKYLTHAQYFGRCQAPSSMIKSNSTKDDEHTSKSWKEVKDLTSIGSFLRGFNPLIASRVPNPIRSGTCGSPGLPGKFFWRLVGQKHEPNSFKHNLKISACPIFPLEKSSISFIQGGRYSTFSKKIWWMNIQWSWGSPRRADGLVIWSFSTHSRSQSWHWGRPVHPKMVNKVPRISQKWGNGHSGFVKQAISAS